MEKRSLKQKDETNVSYFFFTFFFLSLLITQQWQYYLNLNVSVRKTNAYVKNRSRTARLVTVGVPFFQVREKMNHL